MMFTQEQINEINDRLSTKGVKDTQFQPVALPLSGDENISLIQQGKNKKIPISSFYEEFARHIEGAVRVDLFNVSKYAQAAQGSSETVLLTLEEAIELCPADVRRPGQIITFLNSDTNEWEEWQYTATNNTYWEDSTYWKLSSTGVMSNQSGAKSISISYLIDSRNATSAGNAHLPNVDAMYGPYNSKQLAWNALSTPNSSGTTALVIGKTVGIIEDGTIVEYWFESACNNINDLVKKNASVDTEEDDLTLENGVLQFANRSSLNGLGYIILRTDKTLEQQITNANTIYEIRHNFDLGTTSLNIPSGCILEFIGGSISGGNITFNNTVIAGNYKFNNVVTASGQIELEVLECDKFTFASDIEELKFVLSQNKVNEIYLRKNHTYNINTETLLNYFVLKDGIFNQSIFGNGAAIVDACDADVRYASANKFFDFLRITNSTNVHIYNLNYQCADDTIEKLDSGTNEWETFGMTPVKFTDCDNVSVIDLVGTNLCNGVSIARSKHVKVTATMTNVGYNLMLNDVEYAETYLKTYTHTHRFVYAGGVRNSSISVDVRGDAYTLTNSGVILQDYNYTDDGTQIFKHCQNITINIRVYAKLTRIYQQVTNPRILFIRHMMYSSNSRNYGYLVDGLEINAEFFNQDSTIYIYENTMRNSEGYPVTVKGNINVLCHDTETSTENIYPIYISSGWEDSSRIVHFNNTYYDLGVTVFCDGEFAKKKFIRATNLKFPSKITLVSNVEIDGDLTVSHNEKPVGTLHTYCNFKPTGMAGDPLISSKPNIISYSGVIIDGYRTLASCQSITVKNGLNGEYSTFNTAIYDAFDSRVEYPTVIISPFTTIENNVEVVKNGFTVDASHFHNHAAQNEDRRIVIYNADENNLDEDLRLAFSNFETSNITVYIPPQKKAILHIIVKNSLVYYSIEKDYIDGNLYIDALNHRTPRPNALGQYVMVHYVPSTEEEEVPANNHKSYWWDGTQWVDSNGKSSSYSPSGSTNPSNPLAGDIFFNSSYQVVCFYNPSKQQWVRWDNLPYYTRKGGDTSTIPTLSTTNTMHIGTTYQNTTTKEFLVWTGADGFKRVGNIEPAGAKTSGTFAQKPTGVSVGYAYFCTDKQTTEGATDGIMIYYKGVENDADVWVDALGRVIS